MYNLSAENQKWVNHIWDKIDQKLKQVVPRTKGKIPGTTSNGVYDDMGIKSVNFWTNGFWSGIMWLMYVGTKDDMYLDAAQESEAMLDKAFENFDDINHDVGFLWHISSGVNYKITGNKASRTRALYAASLLASRYNLNGKYIRACHEPGRQGWAIIDCMMNIPLLYWASKEIDDPRFEQIALSHADTTMENHIRPDGSVKHIVVYDYLNGGIIEELGGQGYEEGSSWSRGQSWGIYGFVLSYIHTGKVEYLDTAKRIAHYFIACVCDDYLPKCDFRSPETPVVYDSAAGAIAACGLLELAKVVPEFEKGIYLKAALNILKAMEKEFCNWDERIDYILDMGTGLYHDQTSHHKSMIYGEYYFIEAIYKLKGFDILFW